MVLSEKTESGALRHVCKERRRRRLGVALQPLAPPCPLLRICLVRGGGGDAAAVIPGVLPLVLHARGSDFTVRRGVRFRARRLTNSSLLSQNFTVWSWPTLTALFCIACLRADVCNCRRKRS